MTPDEIERRLRAVPRLAHDDGDHVVPDYATLARLVAAMLQEREAVIRSADQTVSALHELLWDRERNVPKVDRANDLIWLLHDTLRAALDAAEGQAG